MIETLDNCKSIDDVVGLINSSTYIVDDEKSSERIAVKYAIEASGKYLSLDTVLFHLEYLADLGANFDMSEALKLASNSINS